MSVKVYIDGQEGTTGLKILERFEGRNDIELLRISEDKRKDSAERARLINMSDYTFLCKRGCFVRRKRPCKDNRRFNGSPHKSRVGLRFPRTFTRAPREDTHIKPRCSSRLLRKRICVCRLSPRQQWYHPCRLPCFRLCHIRLQRCGQKGYCGLRERRQAV